MRTIFRIGLVVVAVLAGIFAKSVWVGLLVAGGFLFLDGPSTNGLGGVFLRIFVGLGLLGGAAWLSQLAGRWLWPAIWLLAALNAFLIGSASKLKLPKWLPNVKFILMLLLIILGVISPFLLQGDFASEGFLVWAFASFVIFVGSFFLFTLEAAKQQPNIRKQALWIGLLLVVGVAVIGAFASGVIWVPFLVTPGLLLLFKNWRRWIEGAVFNWKMHLLTILGGVACLIAGTILGNFQTWWYWTLIWVAASLPLFVMGSFMFGEEQTDRTIFLVGVLALILGVCALVFALTGNFILKDMEIISAIITYILVAGGLLVFIVSWNYATTHSNFLAVLMGLFGVVLLLGAQVYTGFLEGWVWIVLWVIGILLMVISVFTLRSFFTKILMALIAVLQLVIILYGRQVYVNLTAGETLNLSQYAVPVLIVLGSLVLLAALGFGIFMMVRLQKVKKAAEKPSIFGPNFDLSGVMKYMLDEDEKEKKKK
jgi:hypothetical protein